MTENVFAKPPLSVWEGIPVFSAPDRFTENYERIAEDDPASLATKGTNPWIPERLWREMEATTIALITKSFSRVTRFSTSELVSVGCCRIFQAFDGTAWTSVEVT